jgi:hypothetical protein
VAVGARGSVGVRVAVAVALAVGVAVAVPVAVGVAVGVCGGLTSVTITSSIVAPHGPPDVPVNVNRVVAPELGGSDVPNMVLAHSMLVGVWGGLIASNEKVWLVDPKATLSVLSAGES